MDEKRIRFKGKLISAALRKNASVGDAEAKKFIDAIYVEWLSSNLSMEEAAQWLDSRLEREFHSLGPSPVWVEEEPSWPFHDGIPMVFLSQAAMGGDSISSALLSPGETVYLFGIRVQSVGGFRMVYKTVSQFEEM